MPNLLLTLQSVESHCAQLRAIIEREPEFHNWETLAIGDQVAVINLLPIATMDAARIEQSASKIMAAIGGTWIQDEGGWMKGRAGRCEIVLHHIAMPDLPDFSAFKAA